MAFTLEYVMSGSTGTKITNSEFITVPEFSKVVRDTFSSINKQHHGFSILFNALVQSEAEMIKLNEHYRSGLHSLHSDSGGLQMITLGLESNDAAREKIYLKQAMYSDVAMSFDEIPIKTSQERATMGVTSLRRFDRDNLKTYATDSGRNLTKQIEFFQKHGGRAKPLAIIHGNDIQSFIDFANYMFDAIPLDMHQYVGGLSISGQSIGEGHMEAVERAFASALVPHNDKHTLHLLGVGSVSRILPYLAFMRSGLFHPDTHMSYDSTTHSGGLVRREYITGTGKRLRPGKQYNRVWEQCYREILKVFPHFEKVITDPKQVFNALTWDMEQRIGQEELFLHVNMGFLCGSIENFKMIIDDCLMSDKNLLKQSADAKMDRLIHNLISIRDIKDFYEWKTAYGMHYSTDRIQDVSVATSTLDEFFT